MGLSYIVMIFLEIIACNDCIQRTPKSLNDKQLACKGFRLSGSLKLSMCINYLQDWACLG